jgi:hypothetical protein
MDSLLAIADQFSIAVKKFALEQKQKEEKEKAEFENIINKLEWQEETHKAYQANLEQSLGAERQARRQLAQQVDHLQKLVDEVVAEPKRQQNRQQEAEEHQKEDQLAMQAERKKLAELAEQQRQQEAEERQKKERKKAVNTAKALSILVGSKQRKSQQEREEEGDDDVEEYDGEDGDGEENEPDNPPSSSLNGAASLKAGRGSRKAAQEGIKRQMMEKNAKDVHVAVKRMKVENALPAGYHTAQGKAQEQERAAIIAKFKKKLSSKLTESQMNRLEANYIKIVGDGHYKVVILAGPDKDKVLSKLGEIFNYFGNQSPQEQSTNKKPLVGSKVTRGRGGCMGNVAGPTKKSPSVSGVKKKNMKARSSKPSSFAYTVAAAAAPPKTNLAGSPAAGGITDDLEIRRLAFDRQSLTARAQNIKNFFQLYMDSQPKGERVPIKNVLNYMNGQVQFQGHNKCSRADLGPLFTELYESERFLLDGDDIFCTY